MIDVAETVSRLAEIKQAHLWCVFINSKGFSRPIGRMCTTSCDHNCSEQHSQSCHHLLKNQIHSKLLPKHNPQFANCVRTRISISKKRPASRLSWSEILSYNEFLFRHCDAPR